LATGIDRQVARVAARVRARRALETFARLAVLALAFALVAVLLQKLGRISGLGGWLVVAGVVPVVGAVIAAARPVARTLAAKILDLKFETHDRATSAVDFEGTAERTEFMEAHLRDAEARAKEVDPAAAVPIRTPRDVVPALVMASLVVGLTFVAFPRERTAGRDSRLTPIEVHTEELEAYREYVRDLVARAEEQPSGPLQEAAEAANRLLEDLAARQIDRQEALRRLGELQDRFLRGREPSAEDLQKALRAMGDELRRSNLTKEMGQKLQEPNLDEARAEAQKLAQALRDKRPESREALEKAREALERAARETPEDTRERIEELRRQMEEERESLLKKKQPEKNGNEDAEERLLKRRQRELERLEREQQMNENLRRQLERLRRQMDDAAETMNRSPEESAEAMEAMAEALNQLANDGEAQEQLARLLERMSDLGEMLRRQRGQGQGQKQKRAGQLGKFFKLAKGGMPVVAPGRQGHLGENGEQGDGQQRGPEGAGEQGQVLQLGEGNDGLMMPMPGMGMPGQGQSQGSEQMGQGIGTAHDPRMGDPTAMRSQRETVQVQGTPNEDGASRSQVIMGAADQGFASGGYRRVYTEYRRVMEEDMDLQDIPPGVRGHLRDYMDLIRPQE